MRLPVLPARPLGPLESLAAAGIGFGFGGFGWLRGFWRGLGGGFGLGGFHFLFRHAHARGGRKVWQGGQRELVTGLGDEGVEQDERKRKDGERDAEVAKLNDGRALPGGGSTPFSLPSGPLMSFLKGLHPKSNSLAISPEKLIVFASARSEQSGRGAGYFEVRPPNLLAPVWSSDAFSPELPPSAHGFVDFRWRGKAAVANLGGNVELLDESQLRDMRRWSIQAAAENAPDFHIRQR